MWVLYFEGRIDIVNIYASFKLDSFEILTLGLENSDSGNCGVWNDIFVLDEEFEWNDSNEEVK